MINSESLFQILVMGNKDVLKEVELGYRLEKPRYPGSTTDDKLNGIYGVS